MATVERTCIGCRARTDATELLRFTALWSDTCWVLTPDDGVARPGRGAHLHPDAHCLELAVRRKAFRRAFKIEGEFDAQLLSATVRERLDQI